MDLLAHHANLENLNQRLFNRMGASRGMQVIHLQQPKEKRAAQRCTHKEMNFNALTNTSHTECCN